MIDKCLVAPIKMVAKNGGGGVARPMYGLQ